MGISTLILSLDKAEADKVKDVLVAKEVIKSALSQAKFVDEDLKEPPVERIKIDLDKSFNPIYFMMTGKEPMGGPRVAEIYLECRAKKQNKFYKIRVLGKNFQSHYGKIGTYPGSIGQRESFTTDDECYDRVVELVREKLKKGYAFAKERAQYGYPPTKDTKETQFSLKKLKRTADEALINEGTIKRLKVADLAHLSYKEIKEVLETKGVDNSGNKAETSLELLRSLLKGEDETENPFHWLMEGGLEVDSSKNYAYGAPRFLTPEEITKWHSYVDEMEEETFRKLYNGIEVKQYGMGNGGFDKGELDYLSLHFMNLKKFLKFASLKQYGAIIFMI